jgi:hypothetical protein
MKNVDDTTMIKLAFESLDLVIPDRSDTLNGGRSRRVAAHDPDQRHRSTATKNGAWHLIQDEL